MIGVEGVESRIAPHERIVVASLVAAATVYAWLNRFVQDDAFISYRYAQNLSDGLGLVWNEGERVEGYTNFLWTLLMALPFELSLDPVAFSMVVGLALFPAGLVLVYAIARDLTGGVTGGALAVALLGSSYTYSAWATGGLETQLQVVLLLGATAVVTTGGGLAGLTNARAVVLSLCAAGAILTRLDSVIHLVILYGYLGLEAVLDRARAARSPGGLARLVALAVMPGAAIVLAWLGWKLSFYGDLLPNTYYAKMAPLSETWFVGLRYVWTFLRSYWLWPLLLVPVALYRPLREKWDRRVALLSLLALATAAYTVRIGGDFMEFRMLVPMLPAAFIVLAWLVVSVSQRITVMAAVALFVVAGSQLHAHTFEDAHGIESVRGLERHITSPAQGWARTGQVLGEVFGHLEAPPLVATSASGAVPFYSGLPGVDVLGLMDPWVARYGIRTDLRHVSPGHNRLAPFDYLVDREVNLVVGAPWVIKDGSRRPPFGARGLSGFGMETPRRSAIPDDAVMKVIELPLDAQYRVFVLYLMPHAGVDRVIAERGITVHRMRTSWGS